MSNALIDSYIIGEHNHHVLIIYFNIKFSPKLTSFERRMLIIHKKCSSFIMFYENDVIAFS